MPELTFGFIGFGEAAFLISKGLKGEGVKEIIAYDVNAKNPKIGGLIRSRADKLSIQLTGSLSELLSKSRLIICATSAKYALQIAKECLPFLTTDHLYVDINATSPMVKEEMGELLAKASVKFVDAAVVESIPKFEHKVPMFASGSGVNDFQKLAALNGLNVVSTGDRAGSASAIKMARSVFMKGFTMLLLETLSLAERYEVTDLILESLDGSITTKSLRSSADLLLTRTANHAERRVAEMDEVIKTLLVNNVESQMSQATRSKLNGLSQLKLNEFFGYQTPESHGEVLKAIRRLTLENKEEIEK